MFESLIALLLARSFKLNSQKCCTNHEVGITTDTGLQIEESGPKESEIISGSETHSDEIVITGQAGETVYTGIERRGRSPMMRHFNSTVDVIAALQDEIRKQLDGAKEKTVNAWYWGMVGTIETGAANASQRIIDNLDAQIPVEEFVLKAYVELTELADRYRNDPTDEDGYGLGTVYAVQRVLRCQE